MDANILTIGTEITNGEIINSNAAWIAERLEERGYTVQCQLSVRDEACAIIAALRQLPPGEVLVVSGGLGPTSDDLTREVLAEWVGRQLVFSDWAWQELTEVYQKRGLPLREAHRKQCHFPEAAVILKNPVGTAHGFQLRSAHGDVFALPGPPRELEGMWKATVEPVLRAGDAPAWHRWTCLGLPESEAAEIVEPMIQGLGLEVGYRASIPYVHLKLRGEKFSADLEARLDKALGSYVVHKGRADLANIFFQGLKGRSLLIQDQVTRGILGQRLGGLRSESDVRVRIEECWRGQPLELSPDDVGGKLVPVAEDPFAVDISWTDARGERRERLQLPYKVPVDSERGARSVTEWALFKWVSWLKA